MKAIYYKKSKQLIIESGLRGFGEVPDIKNFEDHPPVKRFLSSGLLYDNTLQVKRV